MVYETFLESIRSSVQQKLGNGVQVKLHQVLKNNGTVLDSLSIGAPDAHCTPAIYLNSYYEEAENGLPLSVIAEQIVLIHEEQALYPADLFGALDDFEALKSKIVFKLIDTRANAVLLSQVPNYDFLDLSVVFYLIVSEDESGQMTSLIHDEHLKLWGGVTKEELLELATYNTPRILPPCIRPIEAVLRDLECREESSIIFPETPPIYLYVLTNKSGLNGASCLLYKDILKNFADSVEDDLIILPSSIHEVLLTPYKKAFPYEELNEMVSLINQSDVPPEDRLSDHIYHYSREQDCITIPLSASVSSEKANPQ